MAFDEDGKELNLDCDLSQFKKYGSGVKLFFEFLKLFAILFWIMAIVSIPALFSNISGNGLVVDFK